MLRSLASLIHTSRSTLCPECGSVTLNAGLFLFAQIDNMSVHTHICSLTLQFAQGSAKMKILHLTDLHICSIPDNPEFDRRQRLQRCVRSINRHHSDAELCVITGDLADDGLMESYRVLKEILGELSMPVHLTIGNHDIRENFQRSFPDIPRDENQFTQFAIDAGDVRLLILDTLAEGKIYGWLCDKRLSWLDRELGKAGGRDVYVFMHHPAFPIGLRHHEKIGLVQSEQLISICRKHGNVRRIFAGHVHAEANIRAGELYMSLSRGVSQHLLFEQWGANATYIAQTPAYNVILMEGGGESVHFYDLMHESPVIGKSELPPELEWNEERT